MPIRMSGDSLDIPALISATFVMVINKKPDPLNNKFKSAAADLQTRCTRYLWWRHLGGEARGTPTKIRMATVGDEDMIEDDHFGTVVSFPAEVQEAIDQVTVNARYTFHQRR